MTKLFYLNNLETTSPIYYNDLYNYLNSQEPLISDFNNSTTGIIFLKIIKFICNNVDITLNDFSDNYIETRDLNETNALGTIRTVYKEINSIIDLRDYIKKSSSKITIFTSGTTGKPKKITHSISNLIRNVKIGNEYQNNIWGFAYSPCHIAGLLVFFQAILNENSIIDLYQKPQSLIYNFFNKYKITHISSTPTFFRLLISNEGSLNFVNRVSIGGEKSDKHLLERIKAFFPNAVIRNIYASSEAGSLLVSKEDYFFIPNKAKRLVKISKNQLLIHRSLIGITENVEFFEDSWFYTNDIIEWVDKAKGFFRFLNRRGQVVNIGGYKVATNEIEDIINSIPGVIICTLFVKPNSVLGNILCCNVQINKNFNIKELDLKKTLNNILPYYKIPSRFYFIDQIDINSRGKLN